LALTIITDVLIVLASALLVGEIFEQLCLPCVVGEILGGMIIGPSLLGLVVSNDAIQAISSVALFFIIFSIGFELRTQMVRGKLINASLLTLTSFLAPLVLTALLALIFFPFGAQANFVIALAISIPSISIISVLCLQYNLLSTTSGQLILSSVTISDVLAFVIFAGVVHPFESTLTLVIEIAIFIIGFVIVDWILNRKPEAFKQLLARTSSLFRREDFSYVLLIIVGLALSVIFQIIGLSYILGAFFAGLILHDGLIGRSAFNRISKTLSTMNNLFFIPIFFGFAGIEIVLQSIGFLSFAGLALIIVVALGAGVSLTYYVSKNVLQSKMRIVPKQLAGILSGRGAIGIAIATVALEEGTISGEGFSLVILATLAMSLVAPFLAGRMFRQRLPKKEQTMPAQVETVLK
jgi:Kef-type K+ transport system membrane component KefB